MSIKSKPGLNSNIEFPGFIEFDFGIGQCHLLHSLFQSALLLKSDDILISKKKQYLLNYVFQEEKARQQENA